MISEDRLKHMIEVARECQNLAMQKGLSKDYCDAMFIMGFLHDVGYEEDESSAHGGTGENIIRNFEKHIDECCNAIITHGLVCDTWTIFDEILNEADMTISSSGNKITVEERLNDIKNRRGSNSVQYKFACEVVDKLQKFNREVY